MLVLDGTHAFAEEATLDFTDAAAPVPRRSTVAVRGNVLQARGVAPAIALESGADIQFGDNRCEYVGKVAAVKLDSSAAVVSANVVRGGSPSLELSAPIERATVIANATSGGIVVNQHPWPVPPGNDSTRGSDATNHHHEQATDLVTLVASLSRGGRASGAAVERVKALNPQLSDTAKLGAGTVASCRRLRSSRQTPASRRAANHSKHSAHACAPDCGTWRAAPYVDSKRWSRTTARCAMRSRLRRPSASSRAIRSSRSSLRRPKSTSRRTETRRRDAQATRGSCENRRGRVRPPAETVGLTRGRISRDDDESGEKRFVAGIVRLPQEVVADPRHPLRLQFADSRAS